MIYFELQLFHTFDNGNKILSVAEFDRAVRWWYPEFGTDPQALRRAFKEADKNGVSKICFSKQNEILFLYFTRVVLLNFLNFVNVFN